MRLTKRLFMSVCPAALAAVPLFLAVTPAFAQSTGTEAVETVVVTGVRINLNGLMNAAPIARERSVVTSDFLKTQTTGQTVFQSLNFMPGVVFTNNDPYGSSGGDIRVHGQDGNHISLTLDGMPLNDTGNYAIYTNQMIDPEVIDRVSALQGATDIDSPTAAATGGVINIISDKPHEDFGAMASISGGSYSRQRYFARVDSGKIGPWGTTAYATLSYQDYDKFKGPGHERKIQGNFKIEQDIGDVGWFTFAGHWNNNRNNSYYSDDITGGGTTTNTTIDLIHGSGGPGGWVANPAWTVPTSATSTFYPDVTSSGWDRDYAPTCTYNQLAAYNSAHTSKLNTGAVTAAPVYGTEDFTQTTCASFYKLRINPSNTGNLRFSSLWHILPSLTMTVDANLQYVLANGGGYAVVAENDARLKGTSTAAATTGAYSCDSTGCDLNGDGDKKDTVGVYSPSNTNTRRWGFSTSLIYQLMEDQTFQLAYTLDYGLHRQTGQMSLFDPVKGPASPWGGLTHGDDIKTADGSDLRSRDRKSKAIMNQVAFDYEAKWLDGMIQTSLGFRDPFFERDLNQYCYELVNSSTVTCTTQVPNAPAADGTVTFGTSTTKYVMPGHAVKRYNRFLPHTGITFEPFGNEHQFFGTYVQELAAPRTDNLYVGGVNPKTGKYDILASNTVGGYLHGTLPETSSTYELGYRYLGDDLQAALVLWNSQVHNRIVSSYDPVSGTYFDHNVSGVNFSGVDFEANYRILDDLTLYANAGYDHARITQNTQVSKDSSGNPIYALTLNKQLTETPKWVFTGRVTYDVLPELHLGATAQYVSRRNLTEDNNAWVSDYYVADAEVRYDLDRLGMTGSSLKFNVDNIFDKHYFGSLAGLQTCWSTTSGCTSLPYAYEGPPRTFSATLVATY